MRSSTFASFFTVTLSANFSPATGLTSKFAYFNLWTTQSISNLAFLNPTYAVSVTLTPALPALSLNKLTGNETI